MSLLDQILAMILGALPMEPGSKDKEGHFQYIKEEHEFIAQGWKDYFGRLPSVPVLGEATPNDAVEDEAENDETSVPETESKPSVGYKAPPTSHKLTTISSSKKSSSTVPAVPTATPQEQRMALGLIDNEDGDWEDEDDE